MERNGQIMLTAEDGSEEAFFVVEKAEIAGREYLLVTNEPMDEDPQDEMPVEAVVLRVNYETSEKETVVYDVVEDQEEIRIITKYFEELLEDEVSIEE